MAKQRRCLIVERHMWETGGAEQQLQFVRSKAKAFFGSEATTRHITVNVWTNPMVAHPAFSKKISISRVYQNGTRRTNGFPEIGALPPSFVHFEETSNPDEYNVWWSRDLVAVFAAHTGWVRGRDSQYGRARYSAIVDAPAKRLL